MGKNYGTCHICGGYKKLTFEHIPPAKAFNQNKEITYLGTEILKNNGKFPWDFIDRKGKIHQGGIGGHTLCGKCNSDTGGWYARAFVDFVAQAYKQLTLPKVTDNKVKVGLKQIYPLRIIKQVIAMFFSINNSDIQRIHPELRRFVLSKHVKGLDDTKFAIFMYALKGNISRYAGISFMGSFSIKKPRILSELSAPPFGYVLEFSPNRETIPTDYYEVTFFANKFNYDSRISLPVELPILENNTPLPADYRSKEDILKDYIKNKLDEPNNP
ncbi:MAG: hypothetical protein Q8P54_02775 [bacterium]|nr:hypothetical protein [bacterium]